jgi:Domain of unknown function (DUF6456)
LNGKSKTNRTKEEQLIRPMLIERSAPRDADTPENRRARSVTVNLAESPLGWLKARGRVTDRQFAAGELIRRDYESASLGPRVTMRWDAAPMDKNRRAAPGPSTETERLLAAKQRFDGAMACAGSGLSDVLWRVVCACEAMPDAERALGWPARAGRVVLTLALDRVADYYQVPG